MVCRKHLCSRRKPVWSEYGPKEHKTNGHEFISRKLELRKIGNDRRKLAEEKKEREKTRLAQDMAGARQMKLAHTLTH